MTLHLKCKNCLSFADYDISDLINDGRLAICHTCLACIHIAMETTYIDNHEQIHPEYVEVFKKGCTVKIDHPGHPWHEEIAIVVDMKPGFCRLEFNGGRTWVPNYWIKSYEFE